MPHAAPRVLQVVLTLNPGGTERLVLELAKRLHPTLPTAVCCLDERGAWAPELESNGIEVRALGRQAGFRPSLGRDIARFAAAHRATVIHAHHYSPFVYSALARIWRPRVNVVFTEHGRLSDAPPSAKRRFANRALAHFTPAVFAVSDDLKQHLVGEGFGAERVSVIYNGIDVGPLPSPELRREMRQDLAAPDGTFVVGTIARLDPVKNLELLIDAAARLSADVPLTAIIIGDGPERTRLEARASSVEGGSAVRFLGHRNDARQWLAACDAFVNCSISEGVSLTILEAMAAGLPVIATRVGGTPEVIDESCGRLTPSRDGLALEGALRDLVCDPDLRRRLATVARHRVETRFTLERMVREYADVYARLS